MILNLAKPISFDENPKYREFSNLQFKFDKRFLEKLISNHKHYQKRRKQYKNRASVAEDRFFDRKAL